MTFRAAALGMVLGFLGCAGPAGPSVPGGPTDAGTIPGLDQQLTPPPDGGPVASDDGPGVVPDTVPEDAGTDTAACVGSCEGRACGDDGCGQSCGICAPDQSCDEAGSCVAACTPDCSDRLCGDDGCGGSCGDCAASEACDGTGNCLAGCAPRCAGRGCGDDGCSATCGSCATDQSCDPAGACQCQNRVEVVVYTSRAFQTLAEAFAADPSPCGHYYLSLPATADAAGNKTDPRGPRAAEDIRALGPRLHPMAEFHFTSWARVTDLSWYDKGVEFRRRMATKGYDVTASDTWAINEFPSTVRSSATTRQNLRDLVRGLFDGPAGSPKVKGAVFVTGLGHGTVNLGPYKTNLENWIADADFWVDMNTAVRWFGQEVYPDPHRHCVPGTQVGARAQRLNAFVEHLALLASVGPDAANTAQSFLGRAFVPVMGAVFNSAGSRGYGDTVVPQATFEQFVSEQVYAVRAWSGTHAFPDGRIGFAWDQAPDTPIEALQGVARRLASALHHAYDADGGSAARACSPSGAFTFCQCSLPGATFNEAWSTFETW